MTNEISKIDKTVAKTKNINIISIDNKTKAEENSETLNPSDAYTFTPEERETVITISDADKMWDVFSCQQKVINKLNKIGIIPYKTQLDDKGRIVGAFYKIPYNQISFRGKREKKVLTDEQKSVIAERFRKNRKDKKNAKNNESIEV